MNGNVSKLTQGDGNCVPVKVFLFEVVHVTDMSAVVENPEAEFLLLVTPSLINKIAFLKFECKPVKSDPRKLSIARHFSQNSCFFTELLLILSHSFFRQRS